MSRPRTRNTRHTARRIDYGCTVRNRDLCDTGWLQYRWLYELLCIGCIHDAKDACVHLGTGTCTLFPTFLPLHCSQLEVKQAYSTRVEPTCVQST